MGPHPTLFWAKKYSVPPPVEVSSCVPLIVVAPLRVTAYVVGVSTMEKISSLEHEPVHTVPGPFTHSSAAEPFQLSTLFRFSDRASPIVIRYSALYP